MGNFWGPWDGFWDVKETLTLTVTCSPGSTGSLRKRPSQGRPVRPHGPGPRGAQSATRPPPEEEVRKGCRGLYRHQLTQSHNHLTMATGFWLHCIQDNEAQRVNNLLKSWGHFMTGPGFKLRSVWYQPNANFHNPFRKWNKTQFRCAL